MPRDCGGERVGEEDVRRAVALEDAVRDEPVGRALGLDLVGGLAEGERLGLREDVGQQHVVMVAERVESLGEADEIAGDEARALVDELVEGVLAVGAGLAPEDGAGVGSRRASPSSVTCLPLHSMVTCWR